MRLLQNAKAAPAGPRCGLDAKKRLANATIYGSYRGIAISATTPSALRANIEVLIQHVRSEHGEAAFEMPKRDAAVHEAGHAVIYALQGVSVRTIRIFPRRFEGVLCWGGKVLTDGGGWSVDPSTDPLDDLQQAAFTMAGLAAENVLHEGNARPGSSLDEFATARWITLTAARKLEQDHKVVFDAVAAQLAATLADHWTALIAIADELERTHLIHRKRAQELLAPVREAAR